MPTPADTYTCVVNIPHKHTHGQTLKSREKSRHTLGLSAHPSTDTDTSSLSMAMVSGDGSPFLHYLSDNHWSFCCASRIELSMPRCLFIFQPFHFSLDCYCRNSILKAMMTQQQATQGLFRSPELGKNHPVKFTTSFVTSQLQQKAIENKTNSVAYLFWHISRKSLEA